MILVTGGARSGKSRFAEQLAEAAGSRRIYIATGKVFDEEMARRVAKHKMRRGDQWQTYEDHRGIDAFLMAQGASYDSGLLDCVTTLLTNLLFDRLGDIPQDYDFSLPDYDSIQADALEYMGRILDGAEQAALSLVSPLWGDLTGLPPCAIYVGGDEILLDDSRRLCTRLLDAGVPATISIEPGMWHAYLLYGVPEANAAWREIKTLLEE